MSIQFHKIFQDGIEPVIHGDQSFVSVSPDALRLLAKEAFHDLSFYLRKDHLDAWSRIVSSTSASANERFVCSSLIKNAIVSAEGVLPLCQDTGTATIFAWRGEQIQTGIDDKEFLSTGIEEAYKENHLRFSQMAPITMLSEVNTKNNLPAQIDISFSPGNEYRFLFMAKGVGSSNKTVLIQGSKAILNEKRLKEILREKLDELGVAACPPYTIVMVVGGTSPEHNLTTLKLASAGWLDELPVKGNAAGDSFRDHQWEEIVRKISCETGWGAQFGGANMAMDSRVIRLPRHAGSCMISIGVSCSAHRCMIGKINAEGAFLETLDHNPSRLIDRCNSTELNAESINLDVPMAEILQQLAGIKAGSLLHLSGTLVVARDLAHARICAMIEDGESIPEYFINHPIFYAGPAQTPPEFASGSLGPTTADRMDKYQKILMKHGASLISIAKGNRSQSVARACQKFGGFYLGAIGGTAALIAKENIVSSEIIDFAEFGMEAVRRIKVKNLPVFVIYDNQGRKLY